MLKLEESYLAACEHPLVNHLVLLITHGDPLLEVAMHNPHETCCHLGIQSLEVNASSIWICVHLSAQLVKACGIINLTRPG